MKILVLVPAQGELELETLLEDLSAAAVGEPFAADSVAFADELSRRLLVHPQARRYPEIVALGFWMRGAEIARLRADFDAGTDPRIVCVPRGLVFHVPPANVDTLFVYSWMLSLLMGNRNLVRLPSAEHPPTQVLVEVLCDVLGDPRFAALRARTSMIRYGHEQEITEAISRRCDVRVIWGGDATVEAIRRAPLSPHAKELCFPDRYSLSALSARAFLALDDDGRLALAERFYNDVFWFDQAACSSPRLLVWCGEPVECAQASAAFLPLLAAVAGRKGYDPDAGQVLGKEVFSFRAVLDRGVTGYRRFGSALTVLRLESVADLDREHCGAGLLYESFAGGLGGLSQFVRRKDQTLTTFGFGVTELRDFARSTGGKGIDRVVPVGEALSFNRFWDGFDLVRELVRHVYVDPDRGGGGSG